MNRTKKPKIVRQFESRNIEVLKRRLGHFKGLPMYEAFIHVLLASEKKRERCSKEEWGSALYQVYERPDYLDEETKRMNREGYTSFMILLSNIRQHKYKKVFAKLRINSLQFQDDLAAKDGNGNFPIHCLLVPLISHKHMRTVQKIQKKIADDLIHGSNEVELLLKVDSRTLNKELDKYSQQIESDMLMKKHKELIQ